MKAAVSNFLDNIFACDESWDWINDSKIRSLTEAWKRCNHPEWMMYALERTSSIKYAVHGLFSVLTGTRGSHLDNEPFRRLISASCEHASDETMKSRDELFKAIKAASLLAPSSSVNRRIARDLALTIATYALYGDGGLDGPCDIIDGMGLSVTRWEEPSQKHIKACDLLRQSIPSSAVPRIAALASKMRRN